MDWRTEFIKLSLGLVSELKRDLAQYNEPGFSITLNGRDMTPLWAEEDNKSIEWLEKMIAQADADRPTNAHRT